MLSPTPSRFVQATDCYELTAQCDARMCQFTQHTVHVSLTRH